MTFLLTASRDNRQDASYEEIAAVALGAKATLAPQDGGPQGAFGRIVGGFDTLNIEKGPECGPQSQQIAAKCLRLVQGQGGALFQQLAQRRPDRLHLGLQGAAIQCTVIT